MWPFKSKPSSLPPSPKLQPQLDTKPDFVVTIKPDPKKGDLRIRQSGVNKFWVEEYGSPNLYVKNRLDWDHIYIHKQYGCIYNEYYTDRLANYDMFFKTIEDAKLALKRRSETLNEEKYRKDNYVNVYYPTGFKKEKFNEN